MTEVVTRDLSTLVLQSGSNLPAIRSPHTIDLVALDRKVTYFKIKELLNGWVRVYKDYIQDAIWDSDNAARAEKELEEVIRSFDKAMTELGLVISEHQRVITRLEALRAAVRTQPRPGLEGDRLDRFLAKRRAKVRKEAKNVVRGIKGMQDKAATPAWLKRTWQKLWNDVEFPVDPEDEERLRLMATHAVDGFSRTAARKLNIDEDVVAAFGTLQLPVWATETEMRTRHAYMIQIYHPDMKTGDEKMAAKINAARDTLLGYYAPSKKSHADQG
ncbi:hypothetical protein [Bradyrhizobium sp. CCBAU 11357]|uniref:hypothetical protein n=1 Tax=Bradyrhizobium sp. CCBAU 11357 TaxID=1630808 RepID=UPI0023043248|nr:hypothetical protein [Bradyrhizobium sp. CCBAU 11357]MDA9497832.1 hypothetical protein [Bradyrhizobium sp. CCBAU 11357]